MLEALEPAGRGAAALALEQLKKKLASEGLFAEERKKPLPAVPRRIGVLTSPEGAALRDVVRVLRRRFAGVELLLAPAAVQGARAAEELASGLGRLDGEGLDVLLVVRGGGAREDLAAFDDERLVRAIAACHTPVVTGVGHEIDTTLADLAADRRAPTPSAAAEIVVRERRELTRQVAGLRGALLRSMRYQLARARQRLAVAAGGRGLERVPRRVQRARLHLAELALRQERAITATLAGRRERLERLRRALSLDALAAGLVRQRARLEAQRRTLASRFERQLGQRRRALGELGARLHALSPLSVLDRGYSLATRDAPDGPVVEDASSLAPEQTLWLRFARGAAEARVTAIHVDDGSRKTR